MSNKNTRKMEVTEGYEEYLMKLYKIRVKPFLYTVH